MALERMRNSTNICELAKELGIDRSLLYQWRGQMEVTPADERSKQGRASEDPRDAKLREENSILKRALAEKGLEVDFFKGVSDGPFGPPIGMKMRSTSHVV
jgi:transposase-like protein